jgi:hypothetical protein
MITEDTMSNVMQKLMFTNSEKDLNRCLDSLLDAAHYLEETYRFESNELDEVASSIQDCIDLVESVLKLEGN